MHRALLVSELLSLVFLYVEQLDRRTLALSSRGTLARCARTCKAWNAPATRILWHTLDSLLPLLQLFPRDAFTNASRKDPGLWRFKRTLRPVDWEAFTRYAPLIRSLSFREGKDVLPASVVALDMQRPSRYRCAPLLPNLVALKWTVSVSNTLTLCIPLVSPSLRSLLVHVVGAEAPAAERNDAAGGLLCTLVDIAPEIREVNLNIDKLWTVSDVVNPLLSLAHLRTLQLDVGSIGPFILRGLCLHSSLSRLEIDFCGIDESFLAHLSEHRPRPDEFPALKELSIHADMHIVHTTLSLLIRAPLISIAISTFTLIHPASLCSVLSILSHTSPNLREIRIATSYPGGSLKSFEGDTRLDATHLAFDSFLPLLSLKHLQVASFHLFHPVRLEDVDIAVLIGALPFLKEFTMNPAPEWAPSGWKPAATMRSLRWISNNARGLKSLGLAIDYRALGHPISPTTTIEFERRSEAVGEGFKGEVAPPSLVPSPPTPPLTPEGHGGVVTEGGGPIDHETSKTGAVPSLEILSLGVSFIPAGMEDAVAECLVTLFPRLKVLRPSDLVACDAGGGGGGGGGADGSTMKERWERVERGVRRRRSGVPTTETATDGALAGPFTARRKRRRSVSFERTDADLETEVGGPGQRDLGLESEVDPAKREADEYEWGLALLHQT